MQILWNTCKLKKISPNFKDGEVTNLTSRKEKKKKKKEKKHANLKKCVQTLWNARKRNSMQTQS